MEIHIPENHPRYHSLMNREKIIEGCESKVVAPAGLIAHGRGEAFDYLIGEETHDFSVRAAEAAAALFILAEHPIISVNGNVAALCPEELVKLSEVSGAKLEINLFYRSDEREQAILKVMQDAGAKEVLGVGESASARIPEIQHERRRVDPEGILKADVVFVPLEDGDRTEALVKMGKKVITVDLNPLSRTGQKSTVTIVDNIIRAVPLMIRKLEALKKLPLQEVEKIASSYDNKGVIKESLACIVGGVVAKPGKNINI